MSAPTADLSALRALEANWDSYGAVPITEAALRVAEAVAFVPCCDGGIQVELHGGGAEIEIEIGPDGTVTSVFWGKP